MWKIVPLVWRNSLRTWQQLQRKGRGVTGQIGSNLDSTSLGICILSSSSSSRLQLVLPPSPSKLEGPASESYCPLPKLKCVSNSTIPMFSNPLPLPSAAAPLASPPSTANPPASGSGRSRSSECWRWWNSRMGPLLLRRTTPPCDWLGAVFFSLFDAAAGAVGSAAVEMRQEKFNYYDCEGNYCVIVWGNLMEPKKRREYG